MGVGLGGKNNWNIHISSKKSFLYIFVRSSSSMDYVVRQSVRPSTSLSINTIDERILPSLKDYCVGTGLLANMTDQTTNQFTLPIITLKVVEPGLLYGNLHLVRQISLRNH